MLVTQNFPVYECLPRLFIDDLDEFRLPPVDRRRERGSQGSQNELTGMPWESTRSVMRWESAIM